MSKARLYPIWAILTLLAQAGLLASENTFVETTYNDPDWVLVTSNIILRANLCDPSWYEKVFNPCYWVGDDPLYNRYWNLGQEAKTGRAFPMSLIGIGSLDGLYIPEAFGFRLYDADEQPLTTYLGGSKYVTHIWALNNAPDGFEPGTLFVPGYIGELADYSIIVCRYPLRLHKTHNANPNGVGQEEYVTYEIFYENQPEGLSDPTDPNSGPQDTNNVIITDFLPLEMDFNSASDNGVYNSRFHTVTWSIGDLSIGDSGSVYLNIRVNRRASPGSIITNYSEIKSDSLCAAAAVDVNVLYKPSIMTLTKVDTNAPDSVLPGDYITYGITYGPNSQNHNNVRIVDYLPSEVDFNNPSDPNYDSGNHTYTWSIGYLSAGAQEASVMLTVKVNELAEPNGVITNYCKIESDSSYTAAMAETNVSPWQPDPPVIYVDNMAKGGSNTGMSWANAYLDLQDALERAASGYGSQIWVAAGAYKPDSEDVFAMFQLLDGVAIYGGFAATETSLNQRNWLTNETILTGDLDNDGQINASNALYVVTAADVNETAIIDGFTITMGYYAALYSYYGSPIFRHNKITENGQWGQWGGIFCSGSSPTIADCNIQNNSDYGIYSYNYCNSEPNVINCIIKGNGRYGIYCNEPDLMVSNCIIKDNGEDGICCENYNYTGSFIVSNCVIESNHGDGIDYYIPTPPSIIIATNNIIRRNADCGINGYYFCESKVEIKNNWIHNNGTDDSDHGILIDDAWGSTVIIRNNTVTNNAAYGIRRTQDWDDVTISNCIVLDNTLGQLFNCTATYSWTSGDPCFVDSGNNDYHLRYGSPCIDTGDPSFVPEPNETDIDGENRVMDGDANGSAIVDMGADEFYWSSADFNDDGIVNFLDYAVLAAAWLTASGDGNYNEVCDLEDNNTIDYNDLALFCKDWLSKPGQQQSDLFTFRMMGSGYGQGMTQSLGFANVLYQAEQPQTVLEPQLQPEVQSESEPQSQYEPSCDNQVLIDFLEGVLADEQNREMIDEDGIRLMIESLKEQL
jgi:hypothetical protein